MSACCCTTHRWDEVLPTKKIKARSDLARMASLSWCSRLTVPGQPLLSEKIDQDPFLLSAMSLPASVRRWAAPPGVQTGDAEVSEFSAEEMCGGQSATRCAGARRPRPRSSRKRGPSFAALVEVVGERAAVGEDLVGAATAAQWRISEGRVAACVVREIVRGERV